MRHITSANTQKQNAMDLHAMRGVAPRVALCVGQVAVVHDHGVARGNVGDLGSRREQRGRLLGARLVGAVQLRLFAPAACASERHAPSTPAATGFHCTRSMPYLTIVG